MNQIAWRWLSVLLVVQASCSDSSEEPTASATPQGAPAFIERYASLTCAARAQCCAGAFDQDSCKKQVIDSKTLSFVGAQSGGNRYDPAAGERCLAQIERYYKHPLACTEIPFGAPLCDDLFEFPSRGTKKLGENCNTDSTACARDGENFTECRKMNPDGDDNGFFMCVSRPPPGQQGENCQPSVDSPKPVLKFCEFGLFCDRNAGTCQPLLDVGASCQGDGCVPGATCQEGKCAPKVVAGTACVAPVQCFPAHYCDLTTNTCAPRKAIGESCNSELDCQSEVCTEQKCAAPWLACP